jgi:hypothetical protein
MTRLLQYAKAARVYLGIMVIAVGAIGGSLAWYSSRVEGRVRMRVNAERVNGEIIRLDGRIDDVATSLEVHAAEQRKENRAARARTIRTEVMIEQLLRRRGVKPPAKSRQRREIDRAAGIDPDDPLGLF